MKKYFLNSKIVRCVVFSVTVCIVLCTFCITSFATDESVPLGEYSLESGFCSVENFDIDPNSLFLVVFDESYGDIDIDIISIISTYNHVTLVSSNFDYFDLCDDYISFESGGELCYLSYENAFIRYSEIIEPDVYDNFVQFMLSCTSYGHETTTSGTFFQSVLDDLGSVLSWFIVSLLNVIPIFYIEGVGLTFVGLVSVVGFAVILFFALFLAIINLIKSRS